MKFPNSFALALAFAGCFHRSPEKAILQAFGDGRTELLDDSSQTEYVVFEDSITAAVFRTSVETRRINVASKSVLPYCRGVQVNEPHGYAIQVRVDRVMGDSALASLLRDCNSQPPVPAGFGSMGAMRRERTVYLMVRRNGKWIVDKPLYASEGAM